MSERVVAQLLRSIEFLVLVYRQCCMDRLLLSFSATFSLVTIEALLWLRSERSVRLTFIQAFFFFLAAFPSTPVLRTFFPRVDPRTGMGMCADVLHARRARTSSRLGHDCPPIRLADSLGVSLEATEDA
ncbi:hypothetical protein LY76DRAFT_274500 [Colletotrichum caudatum]|nr:hypothetical protein LY76DRAFT_274500 [Colletotrichum caudatum]